MSGRVAAFCAALIIVAGSLSAQGAEAIRWRAVPGASGYLIEIKDTTDRGIVSQVVQGTSFPVTNLRPGSYSFRVSTLNKLRKIESSSEWASFIVERGLTPRIESASPAELSSDDSTHTLTLTGDNLTRETRIEIVSGSLRIEPEFIAPGEFRLTITGMGDPDTDLVIKAINPGGFESRGFAIRTRLSEKALAERASKAAEEKRKAEKDAARNAAGGLLGFGLGFYPQGGLIMGPWRDNLEPFYAGGSIRVFRSIYGTVGDISNEKLYADIDAGVFMPTGSGSMAEGNTESEMIVYRASAGLSWPFIMFSPGPYHIQLLLALRAGASITDLVTDNAQERVEILSLDPFVEAGIALRLSLGKRLFVEPGIQYRRIFYADQPMDSIECSFGLGMRF
jgi:hypothetical protein